MRAISKFTSSLFMMFAICIMNIIDLFATMHGVEHRILSEANPIMMNAVNNKEWVILILAKVVLPIAVSYLIFKLQDQITHVVKMSIILIFAIYASLMVYTSVIYVGFYIGA